jgi:hypothetical protein
VINASTLSFTGSVETGADVSTKMYGVKIGQVTVTGGSAINVFVDNLIGGGGENRTWYDGVGYEAVTIVPAPLAAPAGLGLIGLLAVRRRR